MGLTGKRNRTMKHRITGLLVGAAGLFSAAFLALSGVSCSQPPINCIVMHVPYFAKYTKISGDDKCYPVNGEELGMATYLANNGGKANYQDRSIAIVSATMGDLYQAYNGAGALAPPNDPVITEADKFFAYGDYTNLPDANNICFAGGNGVADLGVSEIDVPDTDGGLDKDMMQIVLPATHYKQEFKNVKIYVTAEIPGQQAVGLMHFEDVLKGCQADYSFVAIAPSVACEATDADGKPTGLPDNEACNPKADPEKGRIFGSGINPSFAVSCDPDTLHCLLSDEGAYLTGRPN